MTERERYKFIMKDSKKILRTKEDKIPYIRATLSQMVTFILRTKNPYYKFRLQNRFLSVYLYLEEMNEVEANKMLKYLGLN